VLFVTDTDGSTFTVSGFMLDEEKGYRGTVSVNGNVTKNLAATDVVNNATGVLNLSGAGVSNGKDYMCFYYFPYSGTGSHFLVNFGSETTASGSATLSMKLPQGEYTVHCEADVNGDDSYGTGDKKITTNITVDANSDTISTGWTNI